MPKRNLFEDEDTNEEITFKTQNAYAKKYDTWREKEEIYKLEQKYGEKALQSEGSSSDSEDDSDEPPEISEEMEKSFLKTLSLLKTKDQRIYDTKYKFFTNQDENPSENKQNESKQMSFADSDEDSDNDGEIFTIEKKAIVPDNGDTTHEGVSGKKSGKLKDYLTGKVDHINGQDEQDLAPLKALWSDPKLNEGEAFLRDYILNKRYLEENDTGPSLDKVRDDADLEADEQIIEEQSKFERAYNFRFEEPDTEYLKRFPRTVNSVRPKDDRRARKRAEVRERKDLEKLRKMEEIARLKALKRKQIQDKLDTIRDITGNDNLPFQVEDLEGEFDPEEHDRRMKDLFDDQFYGEPDPHKPDFQHLDEDLEIENWDKYDVDQPKDEIVEDEPHCEDENFIMDAEWTGPGGLQRAVESSLTTRRRNRKRSKLARLLAKDKPVFVPGAGAGDYSQHMEQYYELDCEDVVGDLPTRFKYRQVVPNDYGLTVEEILLADDKELTQWVPLKKMLKIKPENVQKGEIKTYAQKAADEKLKRKILPSLFKNLPEEPEIVVPVENIAKKKPKKNKNNNDKEHTNENIEDTNDKIVDNNDTTNGQVKNKKKKRKNKERLDGDTSKEHNENMKTKKQKCAGFTVEDTTNEGPSQDNSTKDVSVENKKLHITESGERKIKAKRKLEPSNKVDNELQIKKKKNNKQTHTNSSKNQKHKEKDKFKKKKADAPDNPLGKLTDERLKAFGLNPKKYRGFLKYKKF